MAFTFTMQFRLPAPLPPQPPRPSFGELEVPARSPESPPPPVYVDSMMGGEVRVGQAEVGGFANFLGVVSVWGKDTQSSVENSHMP